MLGLSRRLPKYRAQSLMTLNYARKLLLERQRRLEKPKVELAGNWHLVPGCLLHQRLKLPLIESRAQHPGEELRMEVVEVQAVERERGSDYHLPLELGLPLPSFLPGPPCPALFDFFYFFWLLAPSAASAACLAQR